MSRCPWHAEHAEHAHQAKGTQPLFAGRLAGWRVPRGRASTTHPWGLAAVVAGAEAGGPCRPRCRQQLGKGVGAGAVLLEPRPGRGARRPLLRGADKPACSQPAAACTASFRTAAQLPNNAGAGGAGSQCSLCNACQAACAMPAAGCTLLNAPAAGCCWVLVLPCRAAPPACAHHRSLSAACGLQCRVWRQGWLVGMPGGMSGGPTPTPGVRQTLQSRRSRQRAGMPGGGSPTGAGHSPLHHSLA